MANTLLVDIGNTTIKWAIKNAGDSMDMKRKYYPANVTESFFIDCLANIKKADKVLATCVANNEVWVAFTHAIKSLWGIKTERVVSGTSGFGIINGYERPTVLGSDRWCALIAACHLAKSDFIVISCGSAITIDVATESGEHLGGYILPGLAMMKKSLGVHTAQVNINTHVEQYDSLAPAKTTTGCVHAAVILAAVSLIEAVINRQIKNKGRLQCIITGGDADIIVEYLTAEYLKIPDLVIRGLAMIAENNQV